MQDNTILTMTDIVKTYHMGEEEQVILKKICLTVHKGEFLSILGPSGSGKSTLMNIIGCLDTPTEGHYVLSGRDVSQLDETELSHIRSKEIGFIFQSFQLLQRLTAWENVELPLIYAGYSTAERREIAERMLERVGLENKKYHYPNQLSGGQQQRVAIARALSTNPTILLADEPTGALDQKTGQQVMQLFRELNAEGRTIIMITHDINIAKNATRVVKILDGELSEGLLKMLKDSLKMSWQNIIHNKMRSFLTILGVVIGVTAIIALITIVQGMIDEVNNQFMGLGANKLILQAPGTPLKMGLSENDLNAIASISNIDGIEPAASVKMDVQGNGIVEEDVRIEGKTELYFRSSPDCLERGRPINILDIQSENKVCIINRELEQALFFGENSMGKAITIDGISYTIIGVLADNGNDMLAAMMGDTGGKKIIIPYTNMSLMVDMKHIYSAEISMKNSDYSDETIEAIKAVLNETFNYKEDSFTLIDMNSILETMKSLQNMEKMMLVGIASIALLVGGIGIMNMMLVSVTERTTEIGLRKALGAEPKRIQLQFLLEAVMLSMFGGFIGLIMGVVISAVAASAIGIPLSLSVGAIVIALSFSAGVGIIFGWTPARKASQLNPIDALRSV